MPKRKDIKKILVVGAGPIIIGQACEFDYSGSQASRSLREEGIEVSLINSNPATIMTDRNIAHATYLDPIAPDSIEKIICIISRDSQYLKTFHSYRDWSHHDFRNTDVDDYLLAAIALADCGYSVFRMGKSVEKKLSTNHTRVIDYANSPDQSDFLDIWLMANCRFVITSGTGLDGIADIFHKPAVYVNYMPLLDMISWCDSITVPKLLTWKETGNLLTLNEYLDHDFKNGFGFEDAGIVINDLSPIDILNAALEMDDHLNEKSEASTEDIGLQQQFRKIIKDHHKYSTYHGLFHSDARIGKDFLKKLDVN